MASEIQDKIVRIGGGQGFWGDWLLAPGRLVRASIKAGKQLDYLVLDYLAEVTMSILAKQRESSPETGYARDFPGLVSELLPELQNESANLKIIANAGGLNPRACAEECRRQIASHSLFKKMPKIAVIEGDDIFPRFSELSSKGESFFHLEDGRSIEEVKSNLKSLNVYIGAKSVKEALDAGAQIIISGRVADPCLALGALMHEFDWKSTDYDLLASGVVAGHVIECGAQSSGGNFSAGWEEVKDSWDIGFPVVECKANGEIVVTKPEGTGGIVDRRTVTEQLVYEIGDPKCYITPDVIVDFTSFTVSDLAIDRVLIKGVKGLPAPEKLKVSGSFFAGYFAEGTLVLVGPKVKKKAKICEEIIRKRIELSSINYDELHFEYLGTFSCIPGLSERLSYSEPGEIVFRVAIRGKSKSDILRFTREIAPLVLGGPSGVTGYAGGKRDVRELYAYWPSLVSREFVKESWSILE
ncbi:MAG TPA: DUF1446 domain-containing protein [Oligoflexia bacterium]|nr:DUF1446 domain-containing protein [Oligoflexia bacterium]HMP47455.1 DUF1446 domain-containing protein [Oligoflexia bacterium]